MTDITNEDVVIHLAALSLPNYCQLNKEECFNVNVHGTENVIAAFKSANAYLLFIIDKAKRELQFKPLNLIRD